MRIIIPRAGPSEMTGLGRMTDKLLVAASRLVLLVLVLLNLEADGGEAGGDMVATAKFICDFLI